jgi:hypothetical protein
MNDLGNKPDVPVMPKVDSGPTHQQQYSRFRYALYR